MRSVKPVTQRINLYQSASGKQNKGLLDLPVFAVMGGIGLVLLVAGYLVMQTQIDMLQSEYAKLAAEVARYQQQLAGLQAKVPSSEPDPMLTAEMQQLQQSQARINQAVRLIEQHKEQANGQFAELFRGLARHPVKGLWLQDVRVSANGEEFILRGEALEATLVPRLLRALGKESAFSGRNFRDVRFERLADDSQEALRFELRSRREDTDAG